MPFLADPAAVPTAALGGWDCHCHILPGLDDGPQSMDEAVAMVRMAAEHGTHAMIATPHHIEGLYPTLAGEILERLAELRRRCEGEGLRITLFPGQELALSPDLPARLGAGELLSLGNVGHAVLIELPPLDPPPFWRQTFFELGLRGLTPIIAHVERTVLVSRAELATEMVTAGAAFQVNANAIGRRAPGRRVLDGWLRRGWIACLGSDAHDMRRRPPVLTTPDAARPWLEVAASQPAFLHPDATATIPS